MAAESAVTGASAIDCFETTFGVELGTASQSVSQSVGISSPLSPKREGEKVKERHKQRPPTTLLSDFLEALETESKVLFVVRRTLIDLILVSGKEHFDGRELGFNI